VRLFVGLEFALVPGVKVAEFADKGLGVLTVIGGDVVLDVR
jgi:hypothetical protein